MLIITTSAIESQSFNVVLAQQSCTINLYQKSTGLFLDLLVGKKKIATGVLCRDRVKMIKGKHKGFVGDLTFVDKEGATDPEYTKLGSRYFLAYIETTDNI